MTEFRITFGQRYKHEEHPLGWPHPDGWLSVLAPDYGTARAIVENFLGSAWAFMYEEGDAGFPTESTYPRGELFQLTIETKENQE